jgi:hypothetical protein
MFLRNERAALQLNSDALCRCLRLYWLLALAACDQHAAGAPDELAAPVTSSVTIAAQPAAATAKGVRMTSFEGIRYGFNRSSCSPRFEGNEPDGIKIAAPSQFTFSRQPTREEPDELPFCISMKFGALYLSRFDQVFRSVKVLVVDDQRNETLTGGVWRDRHYVPANPSLLSREELAARTSFEYNNVDLLEFIPLPRRPAKYHIYALLEEHKSNVVTVQVDVP